ncbi:MAG: fibronectin type III domain-containing protein [Thermoplasmatota archaeon]
MYNKSTVSLIPVAILFAAVFFHMVPTASSVDLAAADRHFDREKGALSGMSFFTENRGQIDNDHIRLVGTSASGAVGFAEDGIILKLPGASSTSLREVNGMEDGSPFRQMKIGFDGGNEVVPAGRGPLPWRSNFFLGNDPSNWRAGVPNYAEVVYEDVWDDIDIVYRATDIGLKYDLILRPGSDPDDISLKIEGSDGHPRSIGGALEIPLAPGLMVVDGGLDVFYSDEVHEKIASSILVEGNTYRFELDAYDPSRTVVIDPLIYSTFLGGIGWEEGWDMDLDSEGCAYLSRYTASVDFPVTSGSYDTTHNGGDWDVYVTKLNATGDGLRYSTFIGGSGFDTGVAITVDRYGFAYVGGVTDSTDFPITPGAYDNTLDSENKDIFMLKLGQNGESLQYSTFFGGGGEDAVHRITADDEGYVFFAGMTASTDLPVTPGCYDNTYNGGLNDAFAARLTPGGNSLVFSTYLGGSGDDKAFGIDIDDKGSPYIFGELSSKDFPTTPGAFDNSHNGGEWDCFLSKLTPQGNSLVYSTYIGGGKNEQAQGIKVDSEGYAYLTGATTSGSFPLSAGAFDRSQGGARDAFVTKVNISGDIIIYSTFLGDDNDEVGYGIDVDHEGYAYVVGTTESRNFPVTDFVLYRTSRGNVDIFITKVNRQGTGLRYSTYYGGNGDDMGTGIAVDRNSCATITGTTNSHNFPTSEGAFEETYVGGLYDVFAVSLNMSTIPTHPRALKAQYGDSRIDLSWIEPLDAGGPAKVFYNIYRGETPLGIAYLTTLEETFYNDTGLTNGVTYYYRVSAENDMGEGGFSNEVYATPGRIPGAPRDLAAEPGNNNVTLTWSVPEDDGGFPIAWYDVFRGTDPEDMKMIFRVHDGETHFDETVTNGVTYYYQLTALNKIGQGPPGEIVTVMPAWYPSDPREVTAVASDSRINLTWLVPLSDGGLGLDGYIVYRRTEKTEFEPITDMMNDLFYHDLSVMNGVTYFYQVRAFNSMGAGRWSLEVSAKPETLPTVPLNFSISHDNQLVVLKWLAPETDGGSEITKYEVWRGRSGDSLYFLAEVEEGRRYEDTDVRNGFTYYYKVRAANRLGFSPWSEVLPGTPMTIPFQPTGVEAERVGRGIELKWRPPYSDGGSSIVNYRVYRGSSLEKLEFYVSVGTSLNYTDTNITGDGAYYYRVSAVNSEGEGERSKEAKVVITSWDPPESSTIMNILKLWWIIIPALIIAAIIALLGILTFRYRDTWKEDGRPNFIKMFQQLRIDLKK